MKPNSTELQKRIKLFKSRFKQSGIKLTHQRLEIFQEVAQSIDHPDVETVYKGVRMRIPTISLDTVYRTLWLFLDLGLITTLGSPQIRFRFDANLNTHHHFVCSKCGLTRDFYSEQFDKMKVPLSIKSFGRVETTHVEVRGVCRKCAGKKKQESKKLRKKG